MELHVLVPRELADMKDKEAEYSDEEDQNKFSIAARQLAAKFGEASHKFLAANHKPVSKSLSLSQSANDPERALPPEEELTVASETYSRYDYKRLGYDGEFYHFDFMVTVQIFQSYLNEPTC